MSAFEIVHQGDYLHIVLLGVEREGLEEVFGLISDYVHSPEAKPAFALLLDCSHPNVAFTPYFRQKAEALHQALAHQQGRFAFVFATSLGQNLARLFFRLARPTYQVGIFTQPDKALAWLKRPASSR
jgi:hypothetical protein